MQNLVYNLIGNQLNDSINIVGIHGPQGIGKSTLNNFLYDKFTQDGYNVITMSLDDFYLEYDDMNSFINSINNNLYNFRGLAGTHDLNLLYDTLIKLKNNIDTKIPIFNKKLHNGFGDRDGYKEVKFRPNLIILEGWMLAYESKDKVKDNLFIFNEELKKYKKIQALINIWIILETDNLQNIYDWRLNAESDDGMNIETFKLFMKPYYEIYNNYFIENTQGCIVGPASENKIILNKKREVINHVTL